MRGEGRFERIGAEELAGDTGPSLFLALSSGTCTDFNAILSSLQNCCVTT